MTRWDKSLRTPTPPRDHLQGGQPLPAWLVVYRRFDGRLVTHAASDEHDAIGLYDKLLLTGYTVGVYEMAVNERGALAGKGDR